MRGNSTPAPGATRAAGANDAQILRSWQRNAQAWVRAVRERQIESRREVTDAAIVDAVLARKPVSALDVGCGEGWLARALARHGIRVAGIDVVPELVESAKRAGGGDFRVLSYEDLAAAGVGVRFDVAVCNFSLLGQRASECVVESAQSLLAPGGTLVVQTLHPLIACGELPYRDGWREGSWAGFDDAFCDPAPWYFRTLAGWIRLFGAAGLALDEIREPLHPGTGLPASVIFLAHVRG